MQYTLSESCGDPSGGNLGEHRLTVRRRVGLWLIATVHVALAVICCPMGVKSGEWAVTWLPDPDALIYVASGAVSIHPLILYPLWAGFASGRMLRRITTTSLLLAVFLSVILIRSWWHGLQDGQAFTILSIVLCFVLLIVCSRTVQRRANWCIGIPEVLACPSTLATRIQFRLWHLLATVTLAACLLAAFRFLYPDRPMEAALALWREFARQALPIFLFLLVLLPAAILPWMVLALRGIHGRSIAIAITGVICWCASGCGLCWLGIQFGLYSAMTELVWIQLGASTAGIVSALALRCYGFRIFRPEPQDLQGTPLRAPRGPGRHNH